MGWARTGSGKDIGCKALGTGRVEERHIGSGEEHRIEVEGVLLRIVAVAEVVDRLG